MNVLLLVAASVLIISTTFLSKMSKKIQVPALLAFIFLGMIFGVEGLFKINFSNYKMAENICTVALIFIMFYGGFVTNWELIKPVFQKASVMASIGTVFTAFIIAVFCNLVLKMNLREGFLLGSVISSTDAASVFSILKSNNLSLKNNTDSLLEMESGANDSFAYLMTIISITSIQSEIKVSTIIYMLFAQLAFGLTLGFIISFITLKFFKNFRFENEGLQTAFILGVAILSYILPTLVGGNGFLCVYIVGISLGNNLKINKKYMVHTLDSITSIMQICIFFVLGLLSTPSEIVRSMPIAIVITIFMIFVARPFVSFILLRSLKSNLNQIFTVSWAGLRGASSIVFATMAVVGISKLNIDIFNIVFSIVILSILIQGTTLKRVSKILDMIDPYGNILKTFNDYSEEVDMDFISVKIDKTSNWAGKKISEIGIPRDILITLIERDNVDIIPNGNTVLKLGDEMVMTATTYKDKKIGIDITEHKIDKKHSWANLMLSEITIPKNQIVIMVKRDRRTIVPSGNTIVYPGDIVVLNTLKNLYN